MLATPRNEIVNRLEVLRDDGTPFPPEEFPARLALQGTASTAIMRFRQRHSGDDRWSFVSAAPVVDPTTGAVEYAVSIFGEFTDVFRVLRKPLHMDAVVDVVQAH